MPDPPFTIYCVTAPAAGGVAPGNASYRAHDRTGRAVILHLLRADAETARQMDARIAAAAALKPEHARGVIERAHQGGRVLLAVDAGSGETLRERVAGRPLEIRDLVQAGRQLAEALEAAHAAGVVHGSLAADCVGLAAGNEVRVSGYGYARELRGDPVCAAPEIVRGYYDRRTDIYGIGAILWEMATGETAPRDPMPASQLRPDLPPILDEIIRTALAPAADKRYHTAGGLARALRHFQEGAATSGKLAQARETGRPGRRRQRKRRNPPAESRWAGRMRWIRRLALAGLLAVLLGGGYLAWTRRDTYRKTAFTRATDTGDVLEAAISPDGARLALVRQEPEGRSLWIQAVAGKTPSRLTAPIAQACTAVAFSPDGDRIYFVRGEPGALLSVAVSGGEVREHIKGAASARLSPDGRKVAFLRWADREHAVMTANLDGSGEAVAFARSAPAEFTSVAWEPGGKMFALGLLVPGEGSQLLTSHLDGSYSQPLGWQQWPGRVRTEWLPAGNAVLASGPERGGAGRIWRLSWPEGAAGAITASGDYSGLSLSRNGKTLATVATTRNAQLWVVPRAAGAGPKQITRGEGPDGVAGLDWIGSTHIVYASGDAQWRGLWVIDADGRNSGAILRESDIAISPGAAPDGKSIAFVWLQERARHIWAVAPDGKGLRDVSRTGLQASPHFSPDSQSIYFAAPIDPAVQAPDPGQLGVWKIPAEGGRFERVAAGPAESPAVSPDGSRLAYRVGGEVVVASLSERRVEARLPNSEPGGIGWTPDGRSIVWAADKKGIGNLWAHPLDGGAPEQLTAFTTPGRIHAFAWSRDGKAIALSRGREVRDAVIIHDASW